MKVRDIMTSEGLATATLDTTLAEIAERMRDENVGAIPIVDKDEKLSGIITDRDIVVRAIAEGEDPSECTAEEILTEQLHTIDPEADLEAAADLMARHQIRRLPVVEHEVVIGMISLGDLAVKSDEDEAGSVLEDVSDGVREDGGSQPNRHEAAGRNPGAERGPSSGERGKQEGSESPRARGGRHAGGARAQSAQAGRSRSQSESQPSVAHDLVNAEGEEEFELQNMGSGQSRRRALGQQPSARGREAESVRGRQGGAPRESATRGGQGISNRSRKEENRGRQKVTPLRAEARGSTRASKSRRKAS